MTFGAKFNIIYNKLFLITFLLFFNNTTYSNIKIYMIILKDIDNRIYKKETNNIGFCGYLSILEKDVG